MRRYLSRKEVAEALGISVPTLVTYMQRGDFPEPDAVIGTTRGWSQATVDRVVGRRAQSVRVRNVRAARADADGE